MSDAAKFVVLLLLGAICTVFSIGCLFSVGLGLALLTEQASTWVRTSQWHSMPLAALLKQLRYAPHADWSWTQSGMEQLLSLESSPILIGTAASVWVFVLIIFGQALKKWRPTARLF